MEISTILQILLAFLTILLIGGLVFLKSISYDLKRDIGYVVTLSKIKRIVGKKMTKPYSVTDYWYEKYNQNKDREALCFIQDDGSSISRTYQEIEELSNQVANWGVQQGLKKGDVVCLMIENNPEYVALWLGLAKLGVIISLVNTNLHSKSLQHVVSICNAKHILVSYSLAESPFPNLENWLFDHPTNQSKTGFKTLNLNNYSKEKVDPSHRSNLMLNDTLFYIYTSGTTGMPKAAKVSHLRFYGASLVFSLMFAHSLKKYERIYAPLPFYHSAAGIIAVGLSWYWDGTVITRKKFSASKFWKDCAEYEATTIQYIGELCRYLLSTKESDHDTKHKIKFAYGNGMRPDVWEKFKTRFNIPVIGEFYAATEGNATLVNSYNKTGAVGYISPLASRIYPVKLIRYNIEKDEIIRNESGFCIECKTNEPGELIGMINEKDPTREFKGYTDQAATEKKIIRDVFTKGDKWFRSGDLLRKDKEGFVYFVDRIGDTFRWKGENVATSEVSEILSEVPGVKDVNVYGVTIPGKDGRAGMAAIVSENLDFKKLYEIASKELPLYAIPLFIRLTKEIEITSTLKHRKVELVKEGFSPQVVKEPLYFRDDKLQTYIPLDQNLYEQIINDSIKV